MKMKKNATVIIIIIATTALLSIGTDFLFSAGMRKAYRAYPQVHTFRRSSALRTCARI